jgi:hypothetical protein
VIEAINTKSSIDQYVRAISTLDVKMGLKKNMINKEEWIINESKNSI